MLRSLRDLAACSHELAAALTPRVRRVLLGLRTTLVALDELEVQPAWSYVWTQPRLRVQLFMALSFSTRRLAQAALLEDAGEAYSSTWVLGFHAWLSRRIQRLARAHVTPRRSPAASLQTTTKPTRPCFPVSWRWAAPISPCLATCTGPG